MFTRLVHSWCNRFVQFLRGGQLCIEGVCFEIDAQDFDELGSNETVPLAEDVALALTGGIDPSTFTVFASGVKRACADRSFSFRPVMLEPQSTRTRVFRHYVLETKEGFFNRCGGASSPRLRTYQCPGLPADLPRDLHRRL